MITRLYIKNCLSFKEVDLEFNSGLNIFTGPSGAGKSILMREILASFGLEDVKSEIVEVNLNNSRIKNEEFDINFEEDIVIKCLKKEKARYFLNSQSLSKKTLSEISNNLIKYLSLRDTSDFKSETLIEFLDRYANKNFPEFQNIKIDFDNKYKEFIDIEKRLSKIKDDEKNLEDLKEFAKFEIAKIEEINPFTEKELNHIIEHANGYMKNFIKLMAATGMRPGEIIALKWSDIDFEKRTIKVERTRLRAKKGKEIVDGLTKTMSSNRFVDMLNATHDALMAQLELTSDSEYIFLNQSSMPFYNHDIIGVNFRKILKQSGVKARPLYNLRHTFASQMISRGADITWVSKMLGHKDVSITLKIYTKFIQEDDETRLKKIAQMDKFMVKFDNSDDKNTDK